MRVKMKTGYRMTEILMVGCGIKNVSAGMGFAHF